MNDDMKVVCMSYECIYRESCLRHLENIIIEDDDGPGYRAEWHVQRDDDCYVPVDGKLL